MKIKKYEVSKFIEVYFYYYRKNVLSVFFTKLKNIYNNYHLLHLFCTGRVRGSLLSLNLGLTFLFNS